MSLAERITVTDELDAWLRETRRMIHMKPELMHEEHETSGLVRKHLTEVGVPFRANVGGDGRSLYIDAEVLKKAGINAGPPTGGTGVLATIHGTRGKGPGKCVLLRADMDALPMDEWNDHEYKSRVQGKMHACGHDLHTTVLLGVAEMLSGMTDQFDGTVKLMYQPGEEGGGGAAAMIHDGILEDPPVDAAFALHVGAEYNAGQVAMNAGPRSAAADTFEIRVAGTGGHAAFPQNGVDTTLIAAHILVALQEIVSREISPLDTAVVSATTIHAGTAHNIIPATATLSGTVRTYKPEVRDHIERRMAEIASGVAGAFRAEAETVYVRGYPPMYNDEEAVSLARSVCQELLGEENVFESSPIMAGEDMAFVSEKVPTCMYSLGIRNDDRGIIYPPHHPQFDADEDAIAVGVRTMSAIALRFLGADE